MDTVTAAIIAAITSGAIQGLSETSKKSIVLLYQKLKSMIAKRYDKKVTDAINNVEAEPSFKPYIIVLQERIQQYGLNDDQEIVELSQEILQQHSPGTVIQIKGRQNAVVYGSGKATVKITINNPKEGGKTDE